MVYGGHNTSTGLTVEYAFLGPIYAFVTEMMQK